MPKPILSIISMAMLIVMGCHTIKSVISPPDEPLATKLQGTWVLTYLSGPGAGSTGSSGGGSASGAGPGGISLDATYPDKRPLITFDLAQNEVNGNTGCNPFSSKMNVDGAKITIQKPYAMTMMACNGNGERSFLDALQSVTGYSVSHDVMTLAAGDATVMRLTRK